MKVESYLVRQLAALCREHPIRRKILLVPSRQVGHNLAGWLAREKRGWVNLHVETPLSLAERIAVPSLDSGGMTRLTADESLFVVHAAVARTLEELPAERVESLAAGPGLTQAAASTIDSLRMAGVRPGDLERHADGGVGGPFLHGVYEGYVAGIRELRRYDPADIFEAAGRLVAESGFLSESVLVLTDEARFPAVAARFFKVCRQQVKATHRVGRPDFGVDPPPHAAAARFRDVELLDDPAGAVHPVGQVRVRKLEPRDGDRIQVRDAVGADAEVRGVFREIMTADVPLDRIEIVYTSADPYVPLIATMADLLEVPIAFGEGIPAYLTRPGQAIAGFYRWIAGGLDPSVLGHMLRSGLVSPGHAGVAAGELAEVLQVRRARKGGDEHRAALQRERIARRGGIGSDESVRADRLARVDALERLLSDLLDLVVEGVTSVADLARAGTRFLDTFFRKSGEADARALESIHDRLEPLQLVEVKDRHTTVADVLAELMHRHRVGISAAREGHLYAVPASRAGYSGRSETFVVGLDEGSFPGGAIEDPLLPDHDRRRLSVELDERLGRPGERVWELMRSLGSMPGRVTLVANRFEMIDGRERYASSIFAQAREDLKVTHPPRYAPSFPANQALTESEAWITERDAMDFREAVAGRFAWLASGVQAEAARSSPMITRFDGYLGHPTPELSLRDGKLLSASRLERLASCPYRYFLEDVLRVRALDDPDEYDHRWLDAREFGSAVHEILCDFMTRLKSRDERPDPDVHTDELHDLVEAAADEIRIRIPPETDLAFRADVRRLKRTMDVFLAADSRRSFERALEFELRFGYDDRSPRYPAPVALDLADDMRLLLRGSIDRVDVAADGFVVWDYKTGSSIPFSRTNLFDGEKLQWALYALAYGRLIRGLPTAHGVSRSGYFFVSERESGRRIAQGVPAPEEVARRLRAPIELAELGAFLHFQRVDKNESPCRFCDFRSVCEKERRDAGTLRDAMESDDIPKDVLNRLESWMTLE